VPQEQKQNRKQGARAKAKAKAKPKAKAKAKAKPNIPITMAESKISSLTLRFTAIFYPINVFQVVW
jgi:hypothetical protein